MIKPIPTLSVFFVEAEVRTGVSGLTNQDINDSMASWMVQVIAAFSDGMQNLASMNVYLTQAQQLSRTLQIEYRSAYASNSITKAEFLDKTLVAKKLVQIVQVWWLAQWA